MVKSFREIKASGRGGVKGASERTVLSIASNAKTVAKEIVQADGVLNKIHKAFDEGGRTFSQDQVRQLRASIIEVSDVVHGRLAYCRTAYARGLGLNLDVTRIANQMEDLSALQSKAEILKAVTDASLEDGDLIAIDEVGHLVAEEDEEPIVEEPVIEEPVEEPVIEVPVEEAALAELGDEVVVEEDEVPVEEPVEESVEEPVAEELPIEEPMDDTLEEVVPDAGLGDIEFPESGIDEILTDEILTEDELIPIEDEEIPVVSASAQLKKRKCATARSVEGSNVAAGESDILIRIMSEITR